MRKKLLASLTLALVFGNNSIANAQDFYQKFKKDLNDKTGLSYDGVISLLGQRGSPSGKITPWQAQYYGEANWDIFKSNLGSGSLQASYTKVRYWGRTGDELDQNLGVASDVNDYSTNANYLTQLSYTHQLPGHMDWLSFTFGQFPMYLFDGNPYSANQQTDFNNLALSQNGTYSYPSASMGGFITAAPSTDWTFVLGFQDANNTSGEKMDFSTFNDGDYTTFVSAAYTPNIAGWGKGKYAVIIYNQPGVENRPQESNGWSLNISQDFGDKWAVFSRINGVTKSANLKRSYAIGGVYKDPFNRNELDRVGFAVALNKVNKKEMGENSRDMETVFETYWDWGLGKYFIISPDIQIYLKPAIKRDTDLAAVYSIRATVLF